MPTTSDIEQLINEFISSKTGEKIYLDLSIENVIVLQPLCSRGSISLGAFWIRLLQHSNNYPVYSYPYKSLYHAGKKYELQLRVDGLSLTVNLASGHLTIKGNHIIDWFVTNFPDIMDRYSSSRRVYSKNLKDHFSKEESLQLQVEREKAFSKYFKQWPVEALEKAVSVMDAGKGNDYYEPIGCDGFLSGEDLESHCHIAELLNKQDTKKQLEKLREGAMVQGIVLYRLWKSVLDSWFADQNAKVYIVSPFIDCDRLSDVCNLVLKHRLTACIDTVCVSFGSLHQRFAEVRRKTLFRYPAKDQVFIEYKIYNKIVYPILEFSSSFIAMVKDGKAQILQTNSNFDMNSLQTTKSTSVFFTELPHYYFLEKYLDPVIA